MTQPPEVRRAMWYHPSGWTLMVYAALAGATVWWLGVAYPAVPWVGSAGTLLGLIGALPVAAWIVAQVLWLISNRGTDVFHLIFLMLLGCGLLGLLIVGREIQFVRDREVAEQIRESRLALRRQALEKAQDTLQLAAARDARLAEDPFAQYEGSVPEATLNAMRAVDAEINEALNAAFEQYQSVVSRQELAGPDRWLRLQTREELARERERHVEVYEASRTFMEHLDTLESRYTKGIEALSLEPPADRFAVAEMERLLQTWRRSGLLRIREIDIEISGLAIQAINVLLESWEDWRYERAQSRIVFENPSTEMAFMRLLSEGAALVEEQMRLQSQLRKMLGPEE